MTTCYPNTPNLGVVILFASVSGRYYAEIKVKSHDWAKLTLFRRRRRRQRAGLARAVNVQLLRNAQTMLIHTSTDCHAHIMQAWYLVELGRIIICVLGDPAGWLLAFVDIKFEVAF